MKSSGPVAPGLALGALGSSRDGKDGRKQSECADGVLTVVPHQGITAWAAEGFGLDVPLPCIPITQAHVGAWPEDGMC